MIESKNFQINFGYIEIYNTSEDLTADDLISNDIKISIKPIEIGRVSTGQTIIGGYDVSCEFSLLRTDDEWLSKLYNVNRNTYANNTKIVITYNGGRITMENVNLTIESELDFSGKPNKIKCKADKYYTHDEIQNLIKSEA